ncbi:response regulator [Fulvivirga lutea]|uniref:Response regulator transcription factor n=1 Tax=Fulvivirga lutea TaxID=2810512 RepID=A0A975A2G5_9BACT|nr:response regulator transcription factor [Fulvivirga lutea]QSE98816.1 response regulator transcription factor [Fulvivirga lutea]
MKSIKVLLVDDHKLLLEGIDAMLSNLEFIKIIGKATSGEEAINEANDKNPDVVLMDIIMHGMTGIEASKWIKEQNSEIKIILISSDVSEELVQLAIQAGVDGYLPKNVDKKTLVEAVKTVHDGERFFSKDVTKVVMDAMYNAKNKPKSKPTKSSELTNREFEVLQQLALGKSNHEIADELFISVKTVETHKGNLMAKLDLKNAVDLVKYAIKNKIIEI